MVNVDRIRSTDEVLSPRAYKYEVLRAMTSASCWAEETWYTVNGFLRLLNLYVLVERERESGIDEWISPGLTEAVELEVPDLENGNVVIVELCDRAETAELAW